jgi:hypothetical protein
LLDYQNGISLFFTSCRHRLLILLLEINYAYIMLDLYSLSLILMSQLADGHNTIFLFIAHPDKSLILDVYEFCMMEFNYVIGCYRGYMICLFVVFRI